jgi:glutamate-1-semialdehyde 2,1-aminomutase
LATLDELQKAGVWEALFQHGAQLEAGLCAAAQDAGIPIRLQRVGSMSTLFFSEQPVRDWSSARQADTQRYARYFQAMLNAGIYLAPSQFEAGFLSTAHADGEIEQILLAAAHAFSTLNNGR